MKDLKVRGGIIFFSKFGFMFCELNDAVWLSF